MLKISNAQSRSLKDLSATKRSMHSDHPLRQSMYSRMSESSEGQKGITERVKQILVASKIPLEEFFKQIGSERDGTISNLEFINAFRKLNLGVSLSEINQILMRLDQNQDGRVAYADLLRIFKTE